MAEIKEKVKQFWRVVTFPDDVDKKYDEMCDNSYNKFADNFINLCYLIFFVFSIISLYFLITKEVL